MPKIKTIKEWKVLRRKLLWIYLKSTEEVDGNCPGQQNRTKLKQKPGFKEGGSFKAIWNSAKNAWLQKNRFVFTFVLPNHNFSWFVDLISHSFRLVKTITYPHQHNSYLFLVWLHFTPEISMLWHPMTWIMCKLPNFIHAFAKP